MKQKAARRFNRNRVRQAGQSMVEMAFVLPLFLAMVFAIIEIGRAWSTKQSLTIAAREGSRILVLPYGAGLTYTTESEVQTAAINAVASALNSSGVPVGSATQIQLGRISPGSDGEYGTGDDPPPEIGYTGAVRGQRVGIRITHNFDSPLPLILGMFNNTGSQTGIAMGVSCYMEHE